MRFKNELCLASFLALLMLGTASLTIGRSQASAQQDVQFEVIGWGDQSGYWEETYVVVRTGAEWIEVWRKHIGPRIPTIPCPEINFCRNMVICAFMGKCLTTGYNISLERMWTDEERIHVEIAKYKPPKDAIVGQALTYPYVIASLERTGLEVVFNVTEEDGTVNEYILPEFPMVTFGLIVVMVFLAIVVALTRKTRGNIITL